MEMNANLSCILRLRYFNNANKLESLIATIHEAEANIGQLETVHLGRYYAVIDVEVYITSREHLTQVISRVSELDEVGVLEVRDGIFSVHKKGKIRTINTLPVNSLETLRKVYTPGVAQVCKLIHDDPSWKDTYTNIPYCIAIVTDGTAILGLGNIGPVAGMPVMEGKAALLQQLVGISGVPILLNTTDPDEIVETVVHIAPTFAGIQLEDVASPRCFTIQNQLEKELNIPVMHDDQQGTAVVTMAALINACKLYDIALEEAKIGLIGLGAAGLCIGKFLLRHTGNLVLGTARTEATLRRFAEQGGVPSSLDEVMNKSDIVIAVSGVSGLIKPTMVRKGQIIFALSNPNPEIVPELALAAGAALAIDGTMVNNILGFPGIWRGALDAEATTINPQMYEAAITAIVDSTAEGKLAPSTLDPKVHLAVAHSVARAAVTSGVARRQVDIDYFLSTVIEEPFVPNHHVSTLHLTLVDSSGNSNKPLGVTPQEVNQNLEDAVNPLACMPTTNNLA